MVKEEKTKGRAEVQWFGFDLPNSISRELLQTANTEHSPQSALERQNDRHRLAPPDGSIGAPLNLLVHLLQQPRRTPTRGFTHCEIRHLVLLAQPIITC